LGIRAEIARRWRRRFPVKAAVKATSIETTGLVIGKIEVVGFDTGDKGCRDRGRSRVNVEEEVLRV